VPEQPDRRIHAHSRLHRQQGFCFASGGPSTRA
jgi:hypothetical protein